MSWRPFGSGFVYDETGIIVTAAHVIQPWTDAISNQINAPPPRVIIPVPSEQVADEARWGLGLGTAVAFASNKEKDLAVLRLAPLTPALNLALHPAPLSTTAAEEGDEVAVCGYPLGNRLHSDLLKGAVLVPSFSSGIVSAVVPFSGVAASFVQAIQISAMVNPGNSGGPVFDIQTGQVIGVIVSTTTVNLVPPVPGQPPPVTPPLPSAPTGLARAVPVTFIQALVAELRAAEAAQKSLPPASR
jgi:S1-C subfamily serine protease